MAAERALREYEASGRIPWSAGYHVAHDNLIAATLDDAKAIASRIREGGAEGLASVRAIGVWL